MLKPFKLITAGTLEEAISCAKLGCKILAGGTDIFVMMHKGVSYPALVDISHLKEFKEITFDESEGLVIGALATHSEIEENEYVKKYYPALADGCSKIGSVQVRNKGTIGGNICNASPAADSAGPLMLYDAQVKITGPQGSRTLPVEEFFTGVKTTVLKEGELVVSLHLPMVSEHEGSAYQKLMKRGAMEIGIMSAGIRFICDEQGKCTDARVTLSAVAPTPIRVRAAETALKGRAIDQEGILQAAQLAYEAANPKTWRNSEEWSKDMVCTYIPRAAEIAVKRLKGDC